MKFLLGGIADAFEDKNIRRYSIGAIVSWLSFFVQAVAVSWTAWELTHSTRWLAIIALADAAPNIALMPLGGVIADRYDPFRILLVSYALATCSSYPPPCRASAQAQAPSAGFSARANAIIGK